MQSSPIREQPWVKPALALVVVVVLSLVGLITRR
jgi:hypothetical protein